MATEYNVMYRALVSNGNGESKEVKGIVPAEDMKTVALGAAFTHNPSDVYVTDGKDEERYSLGPRLPDPTGTM